MIDELAKAIDDELMRQYEANRSWDDAKDVIENLDGHAILRAVFTRLMEPPTPDRIAKVAEVTIRKHAASPLTSTPEFWERIVRTILEADRAMIRAAMETGK